MNLSVDDGPIDKNHFCKSPEECVEYYERWADTYDSDVQDLGYRGPQLLAEVCLKFLKNDKNAKVLDFLCGTGELARLLREHGFETIDGLDGSKNMIQKAKESGLYKNLYTETLIADGNSKFLKENFYDVVAGIGVFSPGHMNTDYLHHMYNPAKKNGLIIFGIREPWIEKLNLDSKVKELEKAEVWKLVDKLKMPNYRQDVPAIFYIFKKL